MSEPRVAIVVLNYRNHADTVECVRSLEGLDYDNVEIVIVDNDSQNGSEQVLRDAFPQHTVLQSGANRGYAAGKNVGMRHAIGREAELVVILNNDTVVPTDFLRRLLVHAEDRPQAGVFGALIVNEQDQPDPMSARRVPPLLEIFWNRGPGKWFGMHEGLRQRSYYTNFFTLSEPTAVEIVSGSCMMLRASLLAEIGFLDETTFLFWEEFILAERVRRSRFETLLCPDVRVVHKGGRSVRGVGTLGSRSYLKSLNHYLKTYRGVGVVPRYLTLLGPALFMLPGTLRTALGLRSSAT